MDSANLKWCLPVGPLALVFGSVVVLACQERLVAPADCPNLCPGNLTLDSIDLAPLADQDSSFEGYVLPGQSSSLRVSFQFPLSEDRAVYRFAPRPDSFLVATDSSVPYVLDSVALSVSVVRRDTTVKNLWLYLYRLPATIDSTFTFANAEAAFTPVNLIDSLKVDDSLVSMTVTTMLKGPTLPRVDIPPADSGILAFGVGIRADQGTGIRIGSPGLAPPSFRSFITVPSGDTTLPQQIVRGALFGRFLSQSAPGLDPSLLTIGGMPSARSVIRFPWSTFLRDSAQLVRVTLELVPAAPIVGLRGDTAFIIARPLLADFGSKSPASTSSFFTTTVSLADTTRDTVRFEVRRAATQWQGSNPTPSAFMMQLSPEGASFTRATFGSTRTPGLVARLRVTYANKFPFEAP